MDGHERKAVRDAYRERKVVGGVFALRCAAAGRCWVGRAPDLSTIENRLRFTLERRTGLNRPLQEAWDRHGAQAFAFEALERLEEPDAFLRDRRLKERQAHWLAALGAEPV